MGRVLRYTFLSLAGAVTVLPFFFVVSHALKTYAETVTRVDPNPFSAEFWPADPQWVNFAVAWATQDLGRAFFNTVLISILTVTGVLATSALAAYALAKLRFPGREALFSVILVSLMIPDTVTLIPNFLVVSSLGWIDSLAALTVPFMASGFAIFLLRQFFRQVPEALRETAALDGCSHLLILRHVMLPLSRAPLFTVAFLELLNSWNSLQWPLVVTHTATWRPISIALSRFITEAGPETQLRMAGALIAMAPLVLVYLFAQKQITDAVAATGIKE